MEIKIFYITLLIIFMIIGIIISVNKTISLFAKIASLLFVLIGVIIIVLFYVISDKVTMLLF